MSPNAADRRWLGAPRTCAVNRTLRQQMGAEPAPRPVCDAMSPLGGMGCLMVQPGCLTPLDKTCDPLVERVEIGESERLGSAFPSSVLYAMSLGIGQQR